MVESWHNTEWGKGIYIKTKRRPHGEGKETYGEDTPENTHIINQSINYFILFSNKLLWSIIYLDQLYPI